MARYYVVDDTAARLYLFSTPPVVRRARGCDLPEELVEHHKELVESLEKVESMMLSLMKGEK